MELDDLAGVQAAVARKHEADDAHQSKQMQILTAEHFNAQHDGSEGRIGGAAEQAHQTQRAANAGVQSQQTAKHAAEGSANAEGGHDLAAFKAGGQGHGGEEHFD